MNDQPEPTTASEPAAEPVAADRPSPWASPLGRWLRGLVLDASSDLPSLSEVIAPVREELERVSALGILFVRLVPRGRLLEIYSWREIDEIYRSISRMALGQLGIGLRHLDLPTDVGLQGEGFAVVLSGPREHDSLSVAEVEAIGDRLAAGIAQGLGEALVSRVHQRLDLAVGASVLERPHGDVTLEDAVVAALVAADASARASQAAREAQLAEELGEVLAGDRFSLRFRPLVDLDSGAIAGWEAGFSGPADSKLEPEDVLLDIAGRGGIEHRLLDTFHGRLLAEDALLTRDGGFLIVRAGSSELLESAVRVNSLLYHGGGRRLSAGDIVFLVDAADALAHFPSSLMSFRSASELGFGLALDLRPDCPLPLDHIRQLEPGYLRLSGRSVQGLHRNQDEFDLLLMIARFAARHDVRVIAADCGDRNEVLVLQRAGVDYASGDYLAPAADRPERPGVQLP